MEQIKKGDEFFCIEDVLMDGKMEFIEFTKGLVYKSEFDNYLTNNSGNTLHKCSNSDDDSFLEKHFKLHTEEEEKWTDLLDDQKEMLNFFPEDEPSGLNTPGYYNNDNGSLYLIAEQRGWNAWQFDIIKRVDRCNKKGEFLSDLEKTKFLIDLYIKETNNE